MVLEPVGGERILTAAETLDWLAEQLETLEVVPADLAALDTAPERAQRLLETACELELAPGEVDPSEQLESVRQDLAVLVPDDELALEPFLNFSACLLSPRCDDIDGVTAIQGSLELWEDDRVLVVCVFDLSRDVAVLVTQELRQLQGVVEVESDHHVCLTRLSILQHVAVVLDVTLPHPLLLPVDEDVPAVVGPV